MGVRRQKYGLDIVQPDHYSFGGMIRSLKEARIGHAMGTRCVLHLSIGFGFICMLHPASTMPDAGRHIEFIGYTEIPLECQTSAIRLEDGATNVPTGPGIGGDADPDYTK